MKTVAQMLRKKQRLVPVNGWEWPLPDQLMGIEIECEFAYCDNLPDHRNPPLGWTVHSDGSLRQGREFVLATPLAGNALSSAIHSIFAGGTKFGRALTSSTHIHMDMLDDVTPSALQTLILMVYVLEPGIFQLADPGREWTGYTNRLATADDITVANLLDPSLSDSTEDQFLRNVDSNNSRYYGLNVKALAKYGSLEFRYFPTCADSEELASWISMVQKFKLAAIQLGSMQAFRNVLDNEEHYVAWLHTTFDSHASSFLKAVPWQRAVKEADRAMSLRDIVTAGDTHQSFNMNAVLGTNKAMTKFAERHKPKVPKRRAGEVPIYLDVDNPAYSVPLAQRALGTERLVASRGVAEPNSLAISGSMIYTNQFRNTPSNWEIVCGRDAYSYDRGQLYGWLDRQGLEWVANLLNSVNAKLSALGSSTPTTRSTLNNFAMCIVQWLNDRQIASADLEEAPPVPVEASFEPVYRHTGFVRLTDYTQASGNTVEYAPPPASEEEEEGEDE